MIESIQQILGLIVSLSTVLGIFTGIINRTFNKKLKPLEDKLDKHEKEDLQNRMSQLRFQVVSFASDLRKGITKTKYEFEAIFKFIDDYEAIIETLQINNNLFAEEVLYIKECYHELNK